MKQFYKLYLFYSSLLILSVVLQVYIISFHILALISLSTVLLPCSWPTTQHLLSCNSLGQTHPSPGAPNVTELLAPNPPLRFTS